jgi:hypothetical protein
MNGAADLGKSASILFSNGHPGGFPQARIVSEMTAHTPNAYGANLIFQTNAQSGNLAERMRIHSNGNIGIGQPVPTRTLDVSGSFKVASGNAFFEAVPSGSYGSVNMNGYFSIFRSGTTDTGAASNQFVLLTPEPNSPHFLMSNNVGIGTRRAVATLDISGGDPALIVRNRAGTAAIRVVSGTFDDPCGIRLFQSTTDQGLFASNLLPMTFYTSNTERMRIGANGNVGIGTNAPFSALDLGSVGAYITVNRLGNVTNSTDIAMIVEGSCNVGMYLQKGGNNNNCGLSFKTLANTAFAERLRIDASTGNVGIRTVPSSLAILDVSGRTRIIADGSSSLTGWGLNNDTDTLILQQTGRYGADPAEGTFFRGRATSLLFANGTPNYPQVRLVSEMLGTYPSGFAANLIFQTTQGAGLAERMRIHTNGFVGIGTAAPLARLDISAAPDTTSLIMSTWPQRPINNALVVRGYQTARGGNSINWGTVVNAIDPNIMVWDNSNAVGASFIIKKSGIWAISYYVAGSPSGFYTWIDASTNNVGTVNHNQLGNPMIAFFGQTALNVAASWTGYLSSNAAVYYKFRSSENLLALTANVYLNITFLYETPKIAGNHPFT